MVTMTTRHQHILAITRMIIATKRMKRPMRVLRDVYAIVTIIMKKTVTVRIV